MTPSAKQANRLRHLPSIGKNEPDLPILGKSAKPGDSILFGRYPQTAEGLDQTPIQWRVLANDGGGLFLLSEYLLDARPYHGEQMEVTWATCDLRRWLNTTFWNAAFTPEEQAQIQPTVCADNGKDSPDTEDRVFLLSVPEIKTFTDTTDGPLRRKAIGTPYALTQRPGGFRLYVYDKGVEADYITENGVRRGCSWWWLRTQSQPEHLDRATFIGARSNIKRYGRVDLWGLWGNGVRPALRLTVPE